MMKGEATQWEKIFTNQISGKGLQNKVSKFDLKKQSIQKMSKRYEETFYRKEYTAGK